MMRESRDDRARWTARWSDARRLEHPPSAWVLQHCAQLPPGAVVLDLACGRGRHAGPVARAGHTVVAVDLVEVAVRAVRALPRVLPVVADAGALPLRAGSFAAIIVVSFLDRTLFPTLIALLEPGGTLIYETYTADHARLAADGRARGPSDPRYLLAHGELKRLVEPLTIIAEREGLVIDDAGERFVAGVVARKSA